MKTFRGERGQSCFRHHHLARCPALAREASGDETERPSFGFLIAKSNDDYAGNLMAFANSSKPASCAGYWFFKPFQTLVQKFAVSSNVTLPKIFSVSTPPSSCHNADWPLLNWPPSAAVRAFRL